MHELTRGNAVPAAVAGCFVGRPLATALLLGGWLLQFVIRRVVRRWLLEARSRR